jgi:hypothetical protein
MMRIATLNTWGMRGDHYGLMVEFGPPAVTT